jgi:serine phosphatase RsbU (regulator of sigma subunit)
MVFTCVTATAGLCIGANPQNGSQDASPMLVDLERAQKIQHQALQYDLPEDPRLSFSTFFRSYDIVGGDYYAIQALDADRYGFLLADMEGHGVAAALYAMHLSILWKRNY